MQSDDIQVGHFYLWRTGWTVREVVQEHADGTLAWRDYRLSDSDPVSDGTCARQIFASGAQRKLRPDEVARVQRGEAIVQEQTLTAYIKRGALSDISDAELAAELQLRALARRDEDEEAADPVEGSADAPWWHALFYNVVGAIEDGGLGHFSGYHAEPDETFWGVDVLEIAPAIVPYQGPGVEEETLIYSPLRNVDVLAIQEAFDEVEGVSLTQDSEEGLVLMVEGRFGGRDVLVRIYADPIDDEPMDLFEDEDDAGDGSDLA
jgi:hypothetical protein